MKLTKYNIGGTTVCVCVCEREDEREGELMEWN